MLTICRGTVITIILTSMFLIGCSSGNNNPVAPGGASDNSPVAGLESEGMNPGNPLIGIWDVVVDPAGMTAEASLPRSTDLIGDAFYCDITFFLTGTPCSDCLVIKGIALDADENIVLTTGVHHPFEPAARLDLNVFDLRMLVAWKDAPSVMTFPAIEADVDGNGSMDGPVSGYFGFLLNAEGYSTIFDSLAEPALGVAYPGNLVPFVNLFVDPSDGNYDITANPDNGFTDLGNPSGRNVFPMGSDEETTELVFANRNGVFEFTIALESAYGQSSIRYTRMDPRYFLPEFNRKEAYSVDINIDSNELLAGDSSTSADLTVSVVDWQAGIDPVATWDPDTIPLDSIRHKSDVKQVILDVPDIMTDSQSMATPDSGDGSFADPYTFSFTMQNTQEAGLGWYVGLVAVRDDMVDVIPGGENWPPMGIERDGLTQHTLRDFTAYNMFNIFVAEEVIPPPVAIISEPDDDIIIESGTWVHFDGSTSTPGGWPAEDYEWDYDYDTVGQIFTLDEFGQTVDHLFTNTTTDPIIYFVALRVTDSLMRSDIDTVRITVNPGVPPSWGDPVRLTFTEDQDDTISLSGDAIAVDSRGVVHVIYSEKAIAPDPADTFRIKYVTYDGSVVSTPEVISGAESFSTPMFGFPQTSPQLPGPSLAIDSSNELHAVWTDISGIQYTYTTGGTWNNQINTYDLDENPDIVPTVAVNANDDVMFTWLSRRYNYYDDTKPMPKVHYVFNNGTATTLVEFNNVIGGEPYLTEMGFDAFALVYVDDNPGLPGSENDFFITRFERAAWETPNPIPLDNPAVLRGYIGARSGSFDLNVVWSDVLASPATMRFKHYTADISSWADDYTAYDDAFVLSMPSPVRIEVLDDGTAFLFWSDTIMLKERCLWVAFNENDDEATILAETTEEIDPDNPVGERQINSTNRDGIVHVIWQDLRNSSSPTDPKQEIYYCCYQ